MTAESAERARRLLTDLAPAPAVWCSGLRKRYRRQVAVDGVSFTVGRGEVVGLLGPNGAGKTTVIKIMLGLVRPDAGEVLLLGRPGRDPAARARVGYLPELFRYQPWLTAAEVLALHVRLAAATVPAAERRECLALVGLGLVMFGGGFVVIAGLAQLVIVRATVDYWPPRPVTGLVLLAVQTAALLTLGLLLSTAISPMASGIVAVGLFGATWVAGIIGLVGEALGNDSVARVGTISRMLLPTDGLWRGAMNAFQDPALLRQVGSGIEESPFLSMAPLTTTYLAWAGLWIAGVLALAAMSFHRRDL